MNTLLKAGLLHVSLAALLCSAQVAAVQTKPSASLGTVFGTVFCVDTRLPARDVEVHLIQVGQEENDRYAPTTDLDGKFLIGHIPEGRYYAFVVQDGYLNLLRTYVQFKAGAMPAEERNWMESYVPIVTVTAGLPTQVTLRLERGAEIAGTVLYDDGSPAIGLRVEIEPKPDHEGENANETLFGNEGDYSESPLTTFHTDDHGRYRIPGVSPGKYLVSVSLPTGSGEPSVENALDQVSDITSVGGLTVYFGDSLRKGNAKPIEVGANSSSIDADITIPLSKLHTIRGHIALKGSGAAPAAAWVRLRYADTRQETRLAVAVNGSFVLHYIPEDTYVVQAAAVAEDILSLDRSAGFLPGGVVSAIFTSTVSSSAERSHGAIEVPLVVTRDIVDLSIDVPNPQEKDAGQATPVVPQ